MARSRSYGSISVDVDVDELFSEISDDLLREECVARGILPKSASPKPGFTSVSLDGAEMAEIHGMILRRDLEGALLHLERMLPRDFRVFLPLVARGQLS